MSEGMKKRERERGRDGKKRTERVRDNRGMKTVVCNLASNAYPF